MRSNGGSGQVLQSIGSSQEARPEGAAANGATRWLRRERLGSICWGGTEKKVVEVLQSSRKGVVRAVSRRGSGRTMQCPEQAGQSWRRKIWKTSWMGVESHGANALPRVERNGNAQAHEKGVTRVEAADVGVLRGQVQGMPQ